MKLADYLDQYGIPPSVMRQKLGTNQTSFRRYLTQERKPNLRTMLEIQRLTDGQVRPEDFLDPSLPKCAIVVTLAGGRRKVVLPWNDRAPDLDACPAAVKAEPDESSRFTPPLQEALDYLGARAKQIGEGWFHLDGRPADARRVVAAANRIKRQRGEPLIRFPGLPEEL